MDRIALVIGGEVISQKNKYENVYIYDKVTFSEASGIAIELEKDRKVDIIISPAGTASEIAKHVTLPIVKTDISDLDILETLIYAESDSKLFNKKIALIMHESKEIQIQRLQLFLKNTLIFCRYDNQDDIKMLIHKLSTEGIALIVGGPTTVEYSKKFGIKGYMLRLTDESIQISINKAKESLVISNRYKLQNQRFKMAISLFNDAVIIIDNRGIITECNEKTMHIFKISEEKVIGMKIEDLTNDFSIAKIYKDGRTQIDKLIKYNDYNLFSNMLPIVVDDQILGAIITLQEVNKIEKLGHKYREYQTRGLVAKYNFSDIKGISRSLENSIRIAKSYAEVDSDVLLSGETGTGKELFAQSIHNSSKRRKGPFVAINCAALPENLLESELMGYEEGAFTGAIKGGKVGLFELAHTGTIFLDEINQLPIHLQGRILRVLQERQVRRLGGNRIVPIDVRVISAVNENLQILINEGKFRKDLYYRISVLNLIIPPLRSRVGDVSLLIKYFYERFTNLYGSVKPFDDDSLKLVEGHPWGGNIRELINFVERYVVISRNLEIKSIDYVQNYMKSNDNSYQQLDRNQFIVNLGTLKEMEKQVIEATMNRFDDNKSQSALSLGISRTTLWKKINEV